MSFINCHLVSGINYSLATRLSFILLVYGIRRCLHLLEGFLVHVIVEFNGLWSLRVMSRQKVCIVCYRKGSRTLSDDEIKSVQYYVIEGYDVNNPDFPSAICSTCNNALCRKRECEDYDLQVTVVDYDHQRPQNLRSASSCACRICTVARCTGCLENEEKTWKANHQYRVYT